MSKFKFKVGDTVKVVHPVYGDEDYGIHQGDISKIVKITPYPYPYNLQKNPSRPMGEDQLELVEEKREEEKRPDFAEIMDITTKSCWEVTATSFDPGFSYINSEKIINKPKKTFMQTLRTVSIKLRAILGDDKANQIVTGLRNDDLSLTSKGREVILEALADGEVGMKALNEKATEIIEEAKKEKN